MRAFIGPNVRTLLKLVGFFLIIQFAYRIGFAVWFGKTAQSFSTSDLTHALYLGFKFDLRMSFIYALPLAILIFFNPNKYQTAKKFWTRFYTFVFFIVNSCFIMDAGYYAYLNTRINGTALRFLINPYISAQMLWETYPVAWVVFSNIMVTFMGYWILRMWVFRKERPFMFAPSFTKYISFTIAVLIFFIGLYGKLSFYPLRWSEAFFTNNSYISSLALNPIHYFIDTFKTSKKTYDRNKVANNYQQVAQFLGVTEPDINTLSFKRIQQPSSTLGDNKPNVVMIVLESFGAYKTGVMQHPLNPSPYFDELSKQGLLFNRFFVPSEGTARSMFSLVSGVPDVTSYRTSSRNPLIAKQNSAVNALKTYKKLYFLGGSANWGEIRGVISSSIPGVKIFEEGMFESPRTDVWGISDLDLFKEAHKNITQLPKDQPFFALIQSAGFHRPYTIPENADDFQRVQKEDSELKKYGFISNEELNSIRFEDFALGKFIELAKTEEYFKNTIFVIIGDHGLPDYNAEHLPKGYRHHNLARFHVPLLFYAPELIPAEVKPTISSEPDVFATIAAMTGHTYVNKGMGRNLLDTNLKPAALMFVYHSIPKQISLITDKFLVSGNVKNGITDIYNWQSETEYSKNLSLEKPDEFRVLKNLGEGLYETSRFMLYNNDLE